MEISLPKGKLNRNLENLTSFPKNNKNLHIIPLRQAKWDIISLHQFLENLNPALYQTPFHMGRIGHFCCYGFCMGCQLQLLYAIHLDFNNQKIKFILHSICDHLKLDIAIVDNKKITFTQEFK